MMKLQVQSLRFVALVVGGFAAGLALMALMNNFSASAVPHWTPVETALIATLGALGSAIFLVEFLRTVWHPAAVWSDSRHFLVAGLFFVGLFLLQYIGFRAVIEAQVR